MLTWLHFGDLQVAEDDQWESLGDFKTLISDANRKISTGVDFAYLPGDVANHGTPEQYRRIREALGGLELDWRAVPGDHDFEPGSLENFYQGLDATRLPAVTLKDGRRCLFLDIVSHGGGGPDFRLGAEQTRWLAAQLDASRQDAERPVVFMHAVPGDLAEDAEGIGTLFADHDVACVDTGHTHYNEVLNDGRVIYGATRSTGQIEEGPLGFSLHAIDGSVVIWRFKALGQSWPFVLITSPADVRLITDPARADQTPAGSFSVRAKVFGAGVGAVSLSVDGEAPRPMAKADSAPALWTRAVVDLEDGRHRLRVQATGEDGREDADEITVRISSETIRGRPPVKDNPGHDAHTLGAWPERGLLGSRLGPNKNGKTW